MGNFNELLNLLDDNKHRIHFNINTVLTHLSNIYDIKEGTDIFPFLQSVFVSPSAVSNKLFLLNLENMLLEEYKIVHILCGNGNEFSNVYNLIVGIFFKKNMRTRQLNNIKHISNSRLIEIRNCLYDQIYDGSTNSMTYYIVNCSIFENEFLRNIFLNDCKKFQNKRNGKTHKFLKNKSFVFLLDFRNKYKKIVYDYLYKLNIINNLNVNFINLVRSKTETTDKILYNTIDLQSFNVGVQDFIEYKENKYSDYIREIVSFLQASYVTRGIEQPDELFELAKEIMYIDHYFKNQIYWNSTIESTKEGEKEAKRESEELNRILRLLNINDVIDISKSNSRPSPFIFKTAEDENNNPIDDIKVLLKDFKVFNGNFNENNNTICTNLPLIYLGLNFGLMNVEIANILFEKLTKGLEGDFFVTYNLTSENDFIYALKNKDIHYLIVLLDENYTIKGENAVIRNKNNIRSLICLSENLFYGINERIFIVLNNNKQIVTVPGNKVIVCIGKSEYINDANGLYIHHNISSKIIIDILSKNKKFTDIELGCIVKMLKKEVDVDKNYILLGKYSHSILKEAIENLLIKWLLLNCSQISSDKNAERQNEILFFSSKTSMNIFNMNSVEELLIGYILDEMLGLFDPDLFILSDQRKKSRYRLLRERNNYSNIIISNTLKSVNTNKSGDISQKCIANCKRYVTTKDSNELFLFIILQQSTGPFNIMINKRLEADRIKQENIQVLDVNYSSDGKYLKIIDKSVSSYSGHSPFHIIIHINTDTLDQTGVNKLHKSLYTSRDLMIDYNDIVENIVHDIDSIKLDLMNNILISFSIIIWVDSSIIDNCFYKSPPIISNRYRIVTISPIFKYLTYDTNTVSSSFTAHGNDAMVDYILQYTSRYAPSFISKFFVETERPYLTKMVSEYLENSRRYDPGLKQLVKEAFSVKYIRKFLFMISELRNSRKMEELYNKLLETLVPSYLPLKLTRKIQKLNHNEKKRIFDNEKGNDNYCFSNIYFLSNTVSQILFYVLIMAIGVHIKLNKVFNEDLRKVGDVDLSKYNIKCHYWLVLYPCFKRYMTYLNDVSSPLVRRYYEYERKEFLNEKYQDRSFDDNYNNYSGEEEEEEEEESVDNERYFGKFEDKKSYSDENDSSVSIEHSGFSQESYWEYENSTDNKKITECEYLLYKFVEEMSGSLFINSEYGMRPQINFIHSIRPTNSAIKYIDIIQLYISKLIHMTNSEFVNSKIQIKKGISDFGDDNTKYPFKKYYNIINFEFNEKKPLKIIGKFSRDKRMAKMYVLHSIKKLITPKQYNTLSFETINFIYKYCKSLTFRMLMQLQMVKSTGKPLNLKKFDIERVSKNPFIIQYAMEYYNNRLQMILRSLITLSRLSGNQHISFPKLPKPIREYPKSPKSGRSRVNHRNYGKYETFKDRHISELSNFIIKYTIKRCLEALEKGELKETLFFDMAYLIDIYTQSFNIGLIHKPSMENLVVLTMLNSLITLALSNSQILSLDSVKSKKFCKIIREILFIYQDIVCNNDSNIITSNSMFVKISDFYEFSSTCPFNTNFLDDNMKQLYVLNLYVIKELFELNFVNFEQEARNQNIGDILEEEKFDIIDRKKEIGEEEEEKQKEKAQEKQNSPGIIHNTVDSREQKLVQINRKANEKDDIKMIQDIIEDTIESVNFKERQVPKPFEISSWAMTHLNFMSLFVAYSSNSFAEIFNKAEVKRVILLQLLIFETFYSSMRIKFSDSVFYQSYDNSVLFLSKKGNIFRDNRQLAAENNRNINEDEKRSRYSMKHDAEDDICCLNNICNHNGDVSSSNCLYGGDLLRYTVSRLLLLYKVLLLNINGEIYETNYVDTELIFQRVYDKDIIDTFMLSVTSSSMKLTKILYSEHDNVDIKDIKKALKIKASELCHSKILFASMFLFLKASIKEMLFKMETGYFSLSALYDIINNLENKIQNIKKERRTLSKCDSNPSVINRIKNEECDSLFIDLLIYYCFKEVMTKLQIYVLSTVWGICCNALDVTSMENKINSGEEHTIIQLYDESWLKILKRIDKKEEYNDYFISCLFGNCPSILQLSVVSSDTFENTLLNFDNVKIDVPKLASKLPNIDKKIKIHLMHSGSNLNIGSPFTFPIPLKLSLPPFMLRKTPKNMGGYTVLIHLKFENFMKCFVETMKKTKIKAEKKIVKKIMKQCCNSQTAYANTADRCSKSAMLFTHADIRMFLACIFYWYIRENIPINLEGMQFLTHTLKKNEKIDSFDSTKYVLFQKKFIINLLESFPINVITPKEKQILFFLAIPESSMLYDQSESVYTTNINSSYKPLAENFGNDPVESSITSLSIRRALANTVIYLVGINKTDYYEGTTIQSQMISSANVINVSSSSLSSTQSTSTDKGSCTMKNNYVLALNQFLVDFTPLYNSFCLFSSYETKVMDGTIHADCGMRDPDLFSETSNNQKSCDTLTYTIRNNTPTTIRFGWFCIFVAILINYATDKSLYNEDDRVISPPSVIGSGKLGYLFNQIYTNYLLIGQQKKLLEYQTVTYITFILHKLMIEFNNKTKIPRYNTFRTQKQRNDVENVINSIIIKSGEHSNYTTLSNVEKNKKAGDNIGKYNDATKDPGKTLFGDINFDLYLNTLQKDMVVKMSNDIYEEYLKTTHISIDDITELETSIPTAVDKQSMISFQSASMKECSMHYGRRSLGNSNTSTSSSTEQIFNICSESATSPANLSLTRNPSDVESPVCLKQSDNRNLREIERRMIMDVSSRDRENIKEHEIKDDENVYENHIEKGSIHICNEGIDVGIRENINIPTRYRRKINSVLGDNEERGSDTNYKIDVDDIIPQSYSDEVGLKLLDNECTSKFNIDDYIEKFLRRKENINAGGTNQSKDQENSESCAYETISLIDFLFKHNIMIKHVLKTLDCVYEINNILCKFIETKMLIHNQEITINDIVVILKSTFFHPTLSIGKRLEQLNSLFIKEYNYTRKLLSEKIGESCIEDELPEISLQTAIIQLFKVDYNVEFTDDSLYSIKDGTKKIIQTELNETNKEVMSIVANVFCLCNVYVSRAKKIIVNPLKELILKTFTRISLAHSPFYNTHVTPQALFNYLSSMFISYEISFGYSTNIISPSLLFDVFLTNFEEKHQSRSNNILTYNFDSVPTDLIEVSWLKTAGIFPAHELDAELSLIPYGDKFLSYNCNSLTFTITEICKLILNWKCDQHYPEFFTEFFLTEELGEELQALDDKKKGKILELLRRYNWKYV